MRELFLITDESDASALVLRAQAPTPAAADGAQQPTADTAEATNTTETDAATTAAADTADAPDNTSDNNTGEDTGEDFYLALTDEVTAALRRLLNGAAEDTTATADAAPAADSAPPAEEATPPAADTTDATQDAPARPSRDIDPGLSAQLTMRPREIQDRIRGGQSVEEVAAAAGVPVARIAGFAHPVLGERARVAETARRAHPVREDGPAPLTLFEIVATAFAARGLDITAATWDAYRDPSHQWVVTLTWKAGLSDNTAEWSYHGSIGTPDTAVARNALAADLIDPDFARPVRTIAHTGRGRDTDDIAAEDEELTRTRDDLRPIRDAHARQHRAQDDATTGAHSGTSAVEEDEATLEGESLLTHPEPVKKKPKSRKAVTPAWEDVLLGVRANTKRPRK